jgi:formylglycine-generating enzyme required for sulfatase activity
MFLPSTGANHLEWGRKKALRQGAGTASLMPGAVLSLLVGVLLLDLHTAHAQHLTPTQNIVVVGEGSSGVYTWNFGSDAGDWLSGEGDYEVTWSIDYGVWTALYLYDFSTTAWEESLYAYREDWTDALHIEMVSVSASTFTMGNSGKWEDWLYSHPHEFPAHTVTLSTDYRIGKYEITNGQFSTVLNWALEQDRLEDHYGEPYSGWSVWKNDQLLLLMKVDDCQIIFDGNRFFPKVRDGVSMADHPVVEVSWFGALAFCNWLSEMEDLPSCYDLETWTLNDPSPNSYRLPTEAEWERAAAWDGDQHWIYGFISDTFSTNLSAACWSDVNPLELSLEPYTAPVGWYDGVNVNPIDLVATQDSPSPVGCYDMSGNVWEWCQDWYDPDYYGPDPVLDPTGPTTGTRRVLRGGCWYNRPINCRTAYRDHNMPHVVGFSLGFRVVRSE